MVFSKLVLSSSSSISHCICNGSWSYDFYICQFRLHVLSFSPVIVGDSGVPAIFSTRASFHVPLSQTLMTSPFSMGDNDFVV